MSDPRQQLADALQNARLSEREVCQRSHLVAERLLTASRRLGSANFEAIETRDLHLLFQITDEVFLAGELQRALPQITRHPLEWRLSKRMITTGGTTTMFGGPRSRRGRIADDSRFEIAIATTPLFQSFGEAGPTLVSGVVCQNRLEALQRVMEHEMAHLAEFLVWDQSHCQRPRFRSLVRRCFGHLESNHQLLNHRVTARREQGIGVGDRVRFRRGRDWVRGRVNRITKRATVLVPDARGRRYTDGNRYATFYVPIQNLQKIA